MKRIEFVGLDVHVETIAIAVAEQGGEVRSLGVIPNREDSVRKLVKKQGPVEELRFCYEFGPTGYALYWQLTRIGAKCEVIAPTLFR
jgi:transposase